jgi:hypothetical protein
VEFGRTSLYRDNAATVAGLAEAKIVVATITFLTSNTALGTVGTLVNATATGAITLYAGDTIYAETYDGSTGGTIFYSVGYRATQFDA